MVKKSGNNRSVGTPFVLLIYRLGRQRLRSCMAFPPFATISQRDEKVALICYAIPRVVANGRSRSSTPTFLLRIRKALVISSAPRGDHEGRDRAIQILAILKTFAVPPRSCWKRMLRKLNDTQSISCHLSVRGASGTMYLPCMPANPIVPLAARLCCTPKLGVGPP